MSNEHLTADEYARLYPLSYGDWDQHIGDSKYIQPGAYNYREPNRNWASTQSVDQLIAGGYALTPDQVNGLTPAQQVEMLYGQQGTDGFDPQYPGQMVPMGSDVNYKHPPQHWLTKLAISALQAGVAGGFAANIGPIFNAFTGAGSAAGAGAGASSVPGLAGIPNAGTAAGAFPLTTAAPSAVEAGLFPLTTTGTAGTSIAAGTAGAGSSVLTGDNVKKVYDLGSKAYDMVTPNQQNTQQPNANQLAILAAIAAGTQNIGGNNMSTWSPQGGTSNMPGATTTGGGSGNFFTGSAPSATTSSRSLMTPEQEGTLSQLLAKLNAGNGITPYDGQLNAQKNNVQTGALQGMGGVMSNLDQNTTAYTGQLSPGNNNLQNISLTALEQMALGNASNNGANQSSVKALTDFTNAGPVDINGYFNSSVQDPMLRDFQNKILPQLTQRFSGQAGFGSDRQRQEQLVTNDMMNTLANSRTNMAFNAHNQANANKMQAAMALPSVTSSGINDMLNMQSGGMKQNAVDQTMLDNQYKDFIRQLSGNTQNANILGQLQTGGNIGQAADQQPLTSQYQEFLRQQGGNQSNINNTINALGIRPFENISTVQGQQNGLLQGLLAGLSQPGGMQGGADIISTIINSLGGGGGSALGDLGSSVMNMFSPQMFNYSDMLGNGMSSTVPDIFSTLGGGNTMSNVPDIFGSLFN